MTTKYDSLILELESWLRGLLHKKEVPKEEKTQAGEWVMRKALEVAREIESGERDPPDDPKKYFKQVIRRALVDWFRTHPKAVGLSPNERTGLDGGLLSVDKGDGEPGVWPTVHFPQPSAGPRSPARVRLPFLLRLVKPPRNPNPTEYARVQELLNAIPNDLRRKAVLLDLQGYRQEQVAEATLRTQQAVSKDLRKQYNAWGWDDEQVQRVQHLMAYDNLVRVFERVCPAEGLEEFDPREDLIGTQDRIAEERLRAHERSYELPREEEAYRRSLPWDGVLDELGQRKKGPWQEKLNRLKAQEARLYQAIMNEPSLTQQAKDLEPYHMQQLIDWMDKDGEWEEWQDDDDNWLRP